MIVSRVIAAMFIGRLSELLGTDESDPEILIAEDSITSVGEDGLRVTDDSGAEAVLIVHGPSEGRQRAISRLLALLDSKQ